MDNFLKYAFWPFVAWYLIGRRGDWAVAVLITSIIGCVIGGLAAEFAGVIFLIITGLITYLFGLYFFVRSKPLIVHSNHVDWPFPSFCLVFAAYLVTLTILGFINLAAL